MRVAGWICLIVGIGSILGSVSKGNSALGGSFVMALGVYFLHRANNKDQK